jgi:hypothetical protein
VRRACARDNGAFVRGDTPRLLSDRTTAIRCLDHYVLLSVLPVCLVSTQRASGKGGQNVYRFGPRALPPCGEPRHRTLRLSSKRSPATSRRVSRVRLASVTSCSASASPSQVPVASSRCTLSLPVSCSSSTAVPSSIVAAGAAAGACWSGDYRLPSLFLSFLVATRVRSVTIETGVWAYGLILWAAIFETIQTYQP